MYLFNNSLTFPTKFVFVEKCFILSINKSLGECLITIIITVTTVIIAAKRPGKDNEGDGPDNKQCLEK